ncbi:MAG: DUF4337 family protein [Planctomycetota bacterium]
MAEIEVPLEELHEHIQHNAHESKEKWISMVALSTAFLAAFAAVAALCSSHFESESMKEHSEAFDKWSYYQSKGIEKVLLQSKVDILAAVGKVADPKDKAKIDEYDAKRAAAKVEAETVTTLSKAHSEAQENFALSVTMFQMSIAIGAISVLTKRRGFWYVSLCLGAVGICFMIIAYTHIPKHEKHAGGHEEKAGEKTAEHAAQPH